MLTDYIGNRVRIIIRKNKAIIGDYMTYKLDKETALYFLELSSYIYSSYYI